MGKLLQKGATSASRTPSPSQAKSIAKWKAMQDASVIVRRVAYVLPCLITLFVASTVLHILFVASLALPHDLYFCIFLESLRERSRCVTMLKGLFEKKHFER